MKFIDEFSIFANWLISFVMGLSFSVCCATIIALGYFLYNNYMETRVIDEAHIEVCIKILYTYFTPSIIVLICFVFIALKRKKKNQKYREMEINDK
jgi:hypothetical protein